MPNLVLPGRSGDDKVAEVVGVTQLGHIVRRLAVEASEAQYAAQVQAAVHLEVGVLQRHQLFTAQRVMPAAARHRCATTGGCSSRRSR